MNKDLHKSRLLGFFDRIGEAADFVNVDHLNLTNLSKPPLKDISKYSTQSDSNDYE